MLARMIQENGFLKWFFQALYVASILLFVNELRFFQNCRAVAKEFVDATKGFVLFEIPQKDFEGFFQKETKVSFESYILNTASESGLPVLDIQTDAVSGSFVKLENAKRIKTRVLKGAVENQEYTKAKQVYFAIPSATAFALKKEDFQPVSKNEAFKKIGMTLFQEAFLFQRLGWRGSVAFGIFFVLLNALFALQSRHALSGIMNLRFFGVPTKTLVPLVIAKNGLLLVLSFGLVGLFFSLLGISLSYYVYLLSFTMAVLMSAFWTFWGAKSSQKSYL
jgi:hypothetical protein